MLIKRITVMAALGLMAFMLPIRTNAQQTDSNTASLVSGNTTFAFDLYQKLRTDETGNFLLSPYSISQALAMTYAGARGTSAQQMAAVLHFDLPVDTLNSTFGALNSTLIKQGSDTSTSPDSALRVANSLWGEKSFQFDSTYLAAMKTAYGAGLMPVDFQNMPEPARQQINDWVATNTENRIQNILPSGSVTPTTRLVLVNALYFKQAWQHEFDTATPDKFTLLDGSTADISMMHQHHSMSYSKGQGYQAVDVPYYNGLSMLIIVPDSGQFEPVEKSLNADMLTTMDKDLKSADVSLFLPRFKFDASFGLADVLQKLGMTDPFLSDKADFSGMAKVTPDTNLSISDVRHKAFIAVDEKGTEAAAATAVIMVGAAAPVAQQPPIVLRVDHPFLFAIRDQQTGSILFLGRVMDPSQTSE